MTVFLFRRFDGNFILLGVVSFGDTECGLRDGRPGVYTNVLSHVSWIRGVIGDETRVMCRTYDGRLCQFPFTFKETTYTSCTGDDDPSGEPWCSTRVDARGRHVPNGGHWGHCSDTCWETSADLKVISNVVENEGRRDHCEGICVLYIQDHKSRHNNKSVVIFCLSAPGAWAVALLALSHHSLGLTN